MNQLLPTTSFRRDASRWSTTSSFDEASAGNGVTASLLLEARRLGARAQRYPGEPVVRTAQRLAQQLEERGLVPDRVTVSREATVVFSWIRGCKIASLECDDEEDLILTLHDREAKDEPRAEVVTLRDRGYLREVIPAFFGEE